MPCVNCSGKTKQLGASKSNGGLYILVYIGPDVEVTEFGLGTGTMYKFGTKKQEFFADYRDVPGLFVSEHGHDLRAKA